jgi:hypothetical protein
MQIDLQEPALALYVAEQSLLARVAWVLDRVRISAS